MLFLRTLGGLSLENGGRPIIGAAGQPRRLAILAVLAVAGDRPVSRDRLLALFWPESDSERARGALKQAIYALRRDVNEQELTLGTTELRLNPQVISADVIEFERELEAGNLEPAVALYRGPFLDGVYIRDAPGLERWIESERQRLTHSFQGALERLAVAAQERSETARALEWWRRLATSDPLSGRVARLYMESLAASGDRETAIRHGLAYARLAREEIEAEPDAGVMQLIARLRNGSGKHTNAPAAREQAPVKEVAVPSPPSAAPASGTMRLGRYRQVAIGAGALLAFVVLWMLMSPPRQEDDVVIVPPFENETGDSASSVIAHMAADWITDGIARSRLVEVVNYSAAVRGARSSSTGPEAGGRAALSAARRLGATILVRGTVLGERDRVTVRAQLIRVGDGRVIFTCEPVAGPSDDPGAVIQGVRQRVLGAFAALGDERFTLWANAESALPRYDAYLAFVQGLDALGRRGVDASRFFLAAARLDTTFTQAKLYLLATWPGAGDNAHAFRDSVYRAAWAQRDRLTAYDQAALENAITGFRADFDGSLVAARRLPQLSPHSAEAHVTHATAAEAANRFREALGAIHQARALGAQASTATFSLQFQDYEIHHYLGDLDGERAEVERARAEHSEDVTVCLQLMKTRAAMGREKSADSLFAECRTLDPALATEGAYVNVGREYVVHGFPDAARRAQERARNWFASRNPPNAEMVAFMDFRLGNWSAVRDFWVEKLQRDSTNTRGIAFLGAAAAHLGDVQLAESMMARIASQRTAASQGMDLMFRAWIAAALSRKDEAVRLLRDAYHEGIAVGRYSHNQPAMDALRGYPAYEALVRPR